MSQFRRGIVEGQILRLRGKGAPGLGNGGFGDALIEVEIEPDPSAFPDRVRNSPRFRTELIENAERVYSVCRLFIAAYLLVTEYNSADP